MQMLQQSKENYSCDNEIWFDSCVHPSHKCPILRLPHTCFLGTDAVTSCIHACETLATSSMTTEYLVGLDLKFATNANMGRCKMSTTCRLPSLVFPNGSIQIHVCKWNHKMPCAAMQSKGMLLRSHCCLLNATLFGNTAHIFLIGKAGVR